MKIKANVRNGKGENRVSLQTDGRTHSITIPPRPSGLGSSANGGELLLLALATCYCNDIYREAERLGFPVQQVEVEAEGEFEAEGSPASNVSYRAKVTARTSEAQILELMRHTDQVAEVQNTLRAETPVRLADIQAQSE
jgi:organic hydroperoxide reductase OsmC/OhrA